MTSAGAYRVEIAARATADAEAIYEWIAERAPVAAARWFNELERRLASLGRLPQRCPLAPEDAVFRDEIRHLLFGRYRILYTIEDEIVWVLHLRHGSRLPLEKDEPR